MVDEVDNLPRSLPLALSYWIGVAGLIVGGYFLVTVVMLGLLAGWLGWSTLMSSTDKLSGIALFALLVAAVLSVTGGAALLREAMWAITLLRTSAWLYIAGVAVMLGKRIIDAATHGFGMNEIHQRIQLVTSLFESLFYLVLFSAAVLLVLRRAEVREALAPPPHGGFEPVLPQHKRT